MLKLTRRFSWELKKASSHPEFSIDSYTYHHGIGARAIHLKNSDINKVFGLLLSTPALDNTGTTHCLEQMVFSGSQRFPVRSLPSAMLDRSLNSYMGAWTGSSFTMFPFATINAQDFDNLLRLYIDAVYFPLLSALDFKRLVCRLEFVNDTLQYTGPLLNEMRGILAYPSNYLAQKVQELLFEGTPYQFNSGGDPEAIRSLLLEQVRAYHQEFYHPSNSTFFMYGDVDVEKCLETIEQTAFAQFERVEQKWQVPTVKRWSLPQETSIRLPPDPFLRSGCSVSMTYVCNDLAEDPYTTFCMEVLSSVLFDHPDSPLVKRLLYSGLAKAFLPSSGYDTSTREATFSIGLMGVDPSKTAAVERDVLNTLSECMHQGFDKVIVDSAIHKLELQYKQVTSNYGLVLLSSLIPSALHNSEPTAVLGIGTFIEKLRSELNSGQKVFQTLIENQLWNNSHKIVATGIPDQELQIEQSKKETKQLQGLEQSLSEEERQQIFIENQELNELRRQQSDLSSLPKLALTDISNEAQSFEYSKSTEISAVPVHFIRAPTNSLTYVRVKVDSTDLPFELRPLLPLYTKLLTQLPTKTNSMSVQAQRKHLFTVSGISCDLEVSCLPSNPNEHRESVILQFGCLDRNFTQAFELLMEYLIQCNFGEQQILAAQIQESVKTRARGLSDEAKFFGLSLAPSSLTSAANAYEDFGVLKHDSSLVAQLLSGLELQPILRDVGSRLQAIHACLMRSELMSLLIHTSTDSLDQKIIDRLGFLLNSLSLEYPQFNRKIAKLPMDPFYPFIYQAYFTIPGNTNYVVESFKGVPFLHQDYAKLTVLSELMSLNMLLSEVKERNGAFEAGVVNDPHKATVSLFSSRDPNGLATFNAFEKAIQSCSEAEFR